MDHVKKLRALAAKYRALARQTANAATRQDRLRAAALLDMEAAHTERAFVSPAEKFRAWGVHPLS